MSDVLYNPDLPDVVLSINSATEITLSIEVDPIVKDPSASITPFDFNQASPLATWNIAHNLARYPDVSVYSLGGLEVVAEILHIDNNNLSITFSLPFAGRARLF